MQKILMRIVACLLSVSVQAQSQMFAQILANREVVTDGEDGSTPTAGVDTSDYSRVLNYGWTGEPALDPTSGIVTARENTARCASSSRWRARACCCARRWMRIRASI